MGSAVSVPAASSEEVAAQVATLGAAFEPYGKRISGDGIDGALLSSLTADDLPALFAELGATNVIHRKKMELVFSQWFQPNEATPPPMEEVVVSSSHSHDQGIRDWLDRLKPGFGARFAAAFEDVGVEDVADFVDVDDEAQAELEGALKSAGAKTIQLKQICKALKLAVQKSQGALPTAVAKSAAPLQVAAAVVAWRSKSTKKFACFISHHKAAAAMEARFVKGELEKLLSSPCFLDSDDLRDLNKLLNYVTDSDVLLLLQTAELFHRPWCLLEAYTAIKEGIPIVALNCEGKGYDFARSSEMLLHLDSTLEVVNPGATCLLEHHAKVAIVDMAFRLSSVIPAIISIPFNSSASSNMLAASLHDVVEAMVQASAVDPMQLGVDKLRVWRASRGQAPPFLAQHGDSAAAAVGGSATMDSASKEHLATTRTTTTMMTTMARVPVEVPQFPAGYTPRQAILDGIKKLLFPTTKKKAASNEESTPVAAADSEVGNQQIESDTRIAAAAAATTTAILRVAVQGLGGSGKTVVAAGLARDAEVASRVEVMVYIALGQTPNIRECQRTMFRQLTGSALDPNLCTEEDCTSAILEATAKRNVLLILDDAWNEDVVLLFESCLDSRTDSRLVATTRIKQILPKISEFELGLLEPDDACALVLEVAGERNEMNAPFDPLLVKACELCGHLPLMLSLCGSMLSQYGEPIDDEFLVLLQEDGGSGKGGELRVGEHGDEHVDLEDRLISSSLRSYKARDKDAVENLFYFLAVLPEDVPMPMQVLKALSTHLEGPAQRHPGRKLRSWVTALIHMSLLKGSISGGVYMHDIVRHFCIVKVGSVKLRANHKVCVEAFLAARPKEIDSKKQFEKAGVAKRESLSYYCQSFLSYHLRESLDETTVGACAADPWISSKLTMDTDQILLASIGVAVGGPKACQAICEHVLAARENKQVEASAFLFAGSLTRLLNGITPALEGQLLLRFSEIICLPELIKSLTEVAVSHVNYVFNRLKVLLVGIPELGKLADERGRVFIDHCQIENIETMFGKWMAIYWPTFTGQLTYSSNKFGTKISKERVIESYRHCRPPCTPREMVAMAERVWGLGPFMRATMIHIGADHWVTFGYTGQFGFDFKDLGEVDEYWGTDEANILAVIDVYNYHVSTVGKSFGLGIEPLFFTKTCEYLAYRFGNLAGAGKYMEKCFALLQTTKEEHGNDAGRMMNYYLSECYFLGLGVPCFCFTIGRKDLAASFNDIFEVDSQERLDSFFESCGPYKDMVDKSILDSFDLSRFICGGPTALREDISADALLRAPEDWQRVDDACFLCNASMMSMLSLGMWAYEENGNDEKAAECAALSLDDGFQKRAVPKINAWMCRARIARRRGDEDGAVGFYKTAAEVAVHDYCPLLSIIAGRDCGGAAGEAMIQRGLLHLPNKTRADFEILGLPTFALITPN